MIEPLSPEVLVGVRQSATLGFRTAQVLVHLLERVEALEAAQQQPHQDKLDRLIALDRDDDKPTPEAAPFVTDEELSNVYNNAPGDSCISALRAIYELGRQYGAAPPAALSDALISAESALSDIAEGEETNAAPNTFKWAEQRCAEALAIIRPVMQRHGIRTSEHLSPAQPAPPTAPAGGLVKKVAPYCAGMGDARSVIRHIAAWLDQQGQHGCSLLLREEAGR